MIKINLIPPEYIDKINRKILVAKIALVSILFVAGLAFVSVYHVTKSKRAVSLLAQREKELKVLQKDVDQVKAIEAQISEVQKYLDAINQITKNRFVYTHFMQDLLYELPATIWFTNIKTMSKGNALNLDFSLKSRSAYDLAYWVNFLEKDERYSKVNMGNLSIKEEDTGKIFGVSIKASYKSK